MENISPVSSDPVAGPSSGVVFGALPPLTSHDKAKFNKIFKASGARNGILGGKPTHVFPVSCRHSLSTTSRSTSFRGVYEVKASSGHVVGDLVRDPCICVRHALTWDFCWILVRNLADVQRRGFLDLTDFTIAMYLIQALMTGKLASIPTALPQLLYEEAGRHSPPLNSVQSHPNLPPPPPMHPTRSNLQTSTPPATISPFADPPPRHPSSRIGPSSRPPSPPWEVSPATKVQADHVFSTLDPRNKGRVKGERVRQYIQQSGLTPHATGRIWYVVWIARSKVLSLIHVIKGFGRYWS